MLEKRTGGGGGPSSSAPDSIAHHRFARNRCSTPTMCQVQSAHYKASATKQPEKQFAANRRQSAATNRATRRTRRAGYIYLPPYLD